MGRKKYRRRRYGSLIEVKSCLASLFHPDVEYKQFGETPTQEYGTSLPVRINEITLMAGDFVFGIMIDERQLGADRQFQFEPPNAKNMTNLILMKKEYFCYVEADYGILNSSANGTPVFGRILLRTNFGREISGGRNKGVTIMESFHKKGCINITMGSSDRTLLQFLQFSIEPELEAVYPCILEDLSDRVHFLSIFELMKRSEIKMSSCIILDIPSLFL